MPPYAIFLSALMQAGSPADTTGYLILGYVVIWLIATVYIATLFSRQRNLKQDIELMRQLLKEDEEEGRR
ncbi:MAG: CcmD family protein [Anaerolineales bacterium]|nr:CcmD family protein [Anaerolineales bacterium]MCB8950616.1 CcmD family protein [Ardenticatenales bacterium]